MRMIRYNTEIEGIRGISGPVMASDLVLILFICSFRWRSGDGHRVGQDRDE